jgi:hypothetical protein
VSSVNVIGQSPNGRDQKRVSRNVTEAPCESSWECVPHHAHNIVLIDQRALGDPLARAHQKVTGFEAKVIRCDAKPNVDHELFVEKFGKFRGRQSPACH